MAEQMEKLWVLWNFAHYDCQWRDCISKDITERNVFDATQYSSDIYLFLSSACVWLSKSKCHRRFQPFKKFVSMLRTW